MWGVMKIIEIKTESDYRSLLETNSDQPVFIFKHSTACWISAEAKKQFDRFADTNDQAIAGVVLVIENRALSLLIAGNSGVAHQSPQVILFKNGKAIWSQVQMEISQAAMEKVLSNY